MGYSFRNDYSSIAIKEVIDKLIECSNEQNIGYGEDVHTLNAKRLIKEKIKRDSDIYFIAGGTITNMIAIGSVLKPYEAVIACDSGHINVHETGAIEGLGHKILYCKNIDGKINISGIDEIIKTHTDHHMVKPRMVYISNSTEVGSVYNLIELKEIYDYCKKNNLYLYLDGARLASALAASDITFSDYGKYTDMFYIGGTKCGSYFGEALVINNDELKKEFNYYIKHFGGMIAKGFVTSIPFEVLMEGNRYIEIGKKENECANLLVEELTKLGLKFYSKSVTNQVFVILPNRILEELYKDFAYEYWIKGETESVIRFVTSFTTEKKHVLELVSRIKELI
ncbi:MAG: aminotransferase class I/II-fold pyridoxal phosphate-dependent enzyme [Acholeplasmatales bacterium]|nr:aminotransferase class I/II-fold pyridoxal phosphate-dependent enzyme [Acholeplasmatales bacterium]